MASGDNVMLGIEAGQLYQLQFQINSSNLSILLSNNLTSVWNLSQKAAVSICLDTATEISRTLCTTHRLASVNDSVSSDILAAAADDVVMVIASQDNLLSALCNKLHKKRRQCQCQCPRPRYTASYIQQQLKTFLIRSCFCDHQVTRPGFKKTRFLKKPKPVVFGGFCGVF